MGMALVYADGWGKGKRVVREKTGRCRAGASPARGNRSGRPTIAVQTAPLSLRALRSFGDKAPGFR